MKLSNYGTDVLKIHGTNNGADRLYGGIPACTARGYGGLGNTNTGSPFLFRDNQYTGSANLTWVLATHSFRFGGEDVHQPINHFQPGTGTSTTPRGGFSFTGGLTSRAESGYPAQNNFNSLADFLLHLPQVFHTGSAIPLAPYILRTLVIAFPAKVDLSQSGSISLLTGGYLRTGSPSLTFPALNTDYIPVPSSIFTNTVPANFRRGYI